MQIQPSSINSNRLESRSIKKQLLVTLEYVDITREDCNDPPSGISSIISISLIGITHH